LKSGLRFDCNYERKKKWAQIQLAIKENPSPNMAQQVHNDKEKNLLKAMKSNIESIIKINKDHHGEFHKEQ
jgi:hypothetical protein